MMLPDNHQDFDRLVGSEKSSGPGSSSGMEEVKSIIRREAEALSSVEKARIQIRGLGYELQHAVHQEAEEIPSPGEFLRRYLAVVGITQKEFAEFIEMKSSNLNAVIKGTRRIGFELSVTLGRIFEVDAALWLMLQNKYELSMLPVNTCKEEPGLEELLKRVG